MLTLFLMILAFFFGFWLLFGSDWEVWTRLLGLILIIGGVFIFVLLVISRPPRVCGDVRTVEPLAWEKSPFGKWDEGPNKGMNYVGSGAGDSGKDYVVKVIDDYGTPHMMKIPETHIAFLGTGTKDSTILRYDITPWGRIISLSWVSRYVVVVNDRFITSGENDLAMYDVPVFHMGKKGISPELKSWLGTTDNARLQGLAEATPEGVK